jgi:electron transfer flavoprotein alpha/beta subunit
VHALALVNEPADLALVGLGRTLGETTAISVVPLDHRSMALLSATQHAGATRTIQLWDAALAETDYLGVAHTLAAAVRLASDNLGAQAAVILCGDRGRGCIGAAVAERLDIPHLGQVLHVEEREGRLLARRQARNCIRLYATAPPALVSLMTDRNAAALPQAGAGAAAVLPPRELETWSLEQVGLDADELIHRSQMRPRPSPGPSAQTQLFTDAQTLTLRLRADGLVPHQPSAAARKW